MVNFYIYAKDYSCSTDGVAYYHKNGLNTLEQFKSDVDQLNNPLAEEEEKKEEEEEKEEEEDEEEEEESRIVYLHWGAECVEVSETEALKAYRVKHGRSYGTWPDKIIEWIRTNINLNEDKIKLLYIITDGSICNSSHQRCLELNENINYDKVVFHALNEDLSCINLSVTASFIKSKCTIYRNNILFDETDISEEFDYDKITVDNFATEKESLKSYIKLKFLNSGKSNAKSLAEIDKLKNLKYRLNSVLTENFPDTMDKNTFLSEFKNTNWYKGLSDPSHDLKVDIEKSITTLINYIVCENRSYEFDALKYETTFSNEVPEEPIEDINFTAEQEIEFPDIILADEKGIPVILCTQLNLLEKLIFNSSGSTASFSKFNTMMECPLFLLEDPDLNESLGYFYTLTVYKQLLEQDTKFEPRSRRPFHGGLVLVDTDDFDRYNDYILSATYFNFKKVKYNIGLFYFVLWKICEKKQWMDDNVVAQFKKYALRRVSTTKCKIGLSSLPLDPQVNSSLPTALWYCVEMSSVLFKDDPEHYFQERLRMFYGVTHAMVEILTYLNYKLDLNTINKRKDLIRQVMILKKIPSQKDKVLYMVEKIFKQVNGFLVSEIEKSANVKKLNYLKLNHKEMLRDEIVNEEVNLEEYVYFLHHTGDSVTHTNICEKTYRPYFMIDQNESFYMKLYKSATEVVVNNIEGDTVLTYRSINQMEFSKILSVYNLYLNCVKDNIKFPTLDKYREYILKKRKFKDDLVTIFPVNACGQIEEVFVKYERVVKDMKVEDFVKTINKYVNRLNRVKGETKVNFKDDKEIEEFITKEERRVNLKKAEPEKKKENL